MVSLRLILLILGLVCLVMAGLGIIAPKVNLQAMGLALWLLAEILR
jgi:hypothetical protein